MVKHLFILWIIILSVGCSENWTGPSIKMTQALGNQIAVALEKYKHKHGTYPEKMRSLVSENLLDIQPPLVGNKIWEYVKENDGYYLGVNGDDIDLDPVLYRTHQSNEWYMDTR